MKKLKHYCVDKREGGSYFADKYQQHFLVTYKAMKDQKFLKLSVPRQLKQKMVYLPKLNRPCKKTLIFDLDETLIHTNNNHHQKCDVVIDMSFPDGQRSRAGVNIRPYVREVLLELRKHCEIIVFTASHKDYMEPIINYIDPYKEIFDFMFHRESCVQHYGLFLKDLRIFQNRDLSQMVLIDNAAYSFSMQVNNGIPCIPFFENKQDTELRDLLPFLQQLYDVPDVRPVLKNYFNFEKLSDAGSAF